MKPLSESLEDLAGRVKVARGFGDGHVRGRPRPSSSSAASEIDEAFKPNVGEFESAVREASADGRTWWEETKASMKRPLDELRARIDNRKSEHELHARGASSPRRPRRTPPPRSSWPRTS